MERERKKKEEKGESPSTKRESLRLPEAVLSFLPSFFLFFPLVALLPVASMQAGDGESRALGK